MSKMYREVVMSNQRETSHN